MLKHLTIAYARFSGFCETNAGKRAVRAAYAVSAFCLIGTGITMFTGNAPASFIATAGIGALYQWATLKRASLQIGRAASA